MGFLEDLHALDGFAMAVVESLMKPVGSSNLQMVHELFIATFIYHSVNPSSSASKKKSPIHQSVNPKV